MNSKRFLIQLQYLGFRFHGVQKQDQHQSIQGRVESALRLKFPETAFTTRFSSRTDAMVSAFESYFLLMFETPQSLTEISIAVKHLPPDIRVLNTTAVSDKFTMLKASVSKEYHYFFAHDEKAPHVFAAPFITVLHEKLDIELMREGAKYFTGTHNFKNYCYKPRPGTVFERTIDECMIEENTELKANFFPEKTYVFKIKAQGFMRGQVRLMMGALMRLGKNEMTMEDLKRSLMESDPKFVKWMVPAAGLVLKKSEIMSVEKPAG